MQDVDKGLELDPDVKSQKYVQHLLAEEKPFKSLPVRLEQEVDEVGKVVQFLDVV
jgi:hypothetical protein